MNEFENPYSTFSLEQRFKETDSLIEHILIAADFLEHQVARVISAEEAQCEFPDVVRKANFTPEQRFGYAIGRTSTILAMDEAEGESLVYFMGRINEIYALRRQLPTMGQAELEARIRRLYHVNKGDEKNWEVITTVIAAFKEVPGNPADLLPTELFDRFAIPIYDFMVDFADEFQLVIADLMMDDEEGDDGELIDLEDDDEA